MLRDKESAIQIRKYLWHLAELGFNQKSSAALSDAINRMCIFELFGTNIFISFFQRRKMGQQNGYDRLSRKLWISAAILEHLFLASSVNRNDFECVGLHWPSPHFISAFLFNSPKSSSPNVINPDRRHPLAKCTDNKLWLFAFASKLGGGNEPGSKRSSLAVPTASRGIFRYSNAVGMTYAAALNIWLAPASASRRVRAHKSIRINLIVGAYQEIVNIFQLDV